MRLSLRRILLRALRIINYLTTRTISKPDPPTGIKRCKKVQGTRDMLQLGPRRLASRTCNVENFDQ